MGRNVQAPEGRWWGVTARDQKGRLVLSATQERHESDAQRLAEQWKRVEYVDPESVEVKQW